MAVRQIALRAAIEAEISYTPREISPGGLLKFKIVFALFNLVVIVSFLVIYVMPLLLLGWDHTRLFWARNWALPVLFFVILAGLNGYFAFNWKLFRLLEREQWDGLIEHLERRILVRKIMLAQQCRVLINAYLIRSRLDSMERLETLLRDTRPRVLARLVMALGVRHLLSNDAAAMTSFFGGFKDRRVRDSEWINWSYAFARLLDNDMEAAREHLLRLVDATRNAILLVLSAYLLDGAAYESSRELASRIRSKYTPVWLASEIDRQKSRIQIVILTKLIEEASQWLFAENESAKLH